MNTDGEMMAEKMDYLKEMEKQKNLAHCFDCDTKWLTWDNKLESCHYCKSKNVVLYISANSLKKNDDEQKIEQYKDETIPANPGKSSFLMKMVKKIS